MRLRMGRYRNMAVEYTKADGSTMSTVLEATDHYLTGEAATPKDVNHNVIMNSNSLLYDCNDNIILMPKDKLIVAQGLDGYIIAEHDNVLLICKKEEQNSIRKFVNDAEMKFGEKYI
mgnify:CR=1 FL=1